MARINMREKVKTVCSGDVQQWKTREAAMAFFLEGAMECDGSEADRYISIYADLSSGSPVGWDGMTFRNKSIPEIDERNAYFATHEEA